MAIIPALCNLSNPIPRWQWLSFIFCIALSSCLLPSESASIQAGYVWNGDPEFANITGPTTAKRVSTTFLASSPSDRYALALTIETSKTSTPTCYLEVFYFYQVPWNYSAPAPPPGSFSSSQTYPWTHPCPRTPLPNGNCTFAFTKDGDIQLLNSVAGRPVLLWSSNTTGLGATSLALRDYDIVNDTDIDGNLVLYNSSGHIVWANERNDSDYSCGNPGGDVSSTSHAAAAKKASVMWLVLVSFGAALVLWDSRSGRAQWLIGGFVLCCLLLPSESKPIQAGFTTSYPYNLTVQLGNETITADFDSQYPLVESPAQRTVLVLHPIARKNRGSTCYLEVMADRNTTDIVVNASSTVEYVPWSVPCPRKMKPFNVYGNCTFTFTVDGDIQVHSSVGGGPYDLEWSSNTAGLGATTLDVLDSDPTGSGSLVLYNNRSQVVWKNVLNMTNQDLQCSTPFSGSAALRVSFASSSLLLLVLPSALLLKFLDW